MKITDFKLPEICLPQIPFLPSLPQIQIPSINCMILQWNKCYNCLSDTHMMVLTDFDKDVCVECYNKIEIKTYIEKYIKLKAFR